MYLIPMAKNEDRAISFLIKLDFSDLEVDALETKTCFVQILIFF